MILPPSFIGLIRGTVTKVLDHTDSPSFVIDGVTIRYEHDPQASSEVILSPGMSLIIQVDLNANTSDEYYAIAIAQANLDEEHLVGIPAEGGLPVVNLRIKTEALVQPEARVIGVLPRPKNSRKGWLIVTHAVEGGAFDEAMVPIKPIPIRSGERVWSDGSHYYIGDDKTPPAVHGAREVHLIHP